MLLFTQADFVCYVYSQKTKIDFSYWLSAKRGGRKKYHPFIKNLMILSCSVWFLLYVKCAACLTFKKIVKVALNC